MDRALGKIWEILGEVDSLSRGFSPAGAALIIAQKSREATLGGIDVVTSEKVGRNVECAGNRTKLISSDPLAETSRHEVADLVHGAGLGILHLVDGGQGVGIGAHHDPVLGPHDHDVDA